MPNSPIPSKRLHSALLRSLVFLAFATTLAACVSPSTRIDEFASRAGLTREVITGMDFRHVVYTRRDANTDKRWTIYLESDGLPWIDGRMPASDPTTRDPLALKLMVRSAHSAIYVARPCYQELMEANCSWQTWTQARYSDGVVTSMVAAMQTKLRELGANSVHLVGYSGGGALAVLIAERLDNVDSVITIGANLDTEAWTTHHSYLPLSESLNPARSERSHPWRELHLQGANDEVVPPATTRAYFERYPNARSITFEDYDHVCCWLRNWPAVLQRIEAQR